MHNLTKVFARRLKEVRELRNMNQTELAQAMGVARSTIYNYERGEFSSFLEVVDKAASVLNIAPAALLNIDTAPEVIRVSPTPREALEIVRKALQQGERLPEEFSEVPEDILKKLPRVKNFKILRATIDAVLDDSEK